MQMTWHDVLRGIACVLQCTACVCVGCASVWPANPVLVAGKARRRGRCSMATGGVPAAPSSPRPTRGTHASTLASLMCMCWPQAGSSSSYVPASVAESPGLGRRSDVGTLVALTGSEDEEDRLEAAYALSRRAEDDVLWIVVLKALVCGIPVTEFERLRGLYELLPLPSLSLCLNAVQELQAIVDNHTATLDMRCNVAIILAEVCEKARSSHVNMMMQAGGTTLLQRLLVTGNRACVFALAALPTIFGPDVTRDTLRRSSIPDTLTMLARSTDPEVSFLSRWVLRNVLRVQVDGIDSAARRVSQPRDTVRMSAADATPGIKLSEEGWTVRTDALSFETVRASHSVSQQRWYYEVQLHTGGLIQLGWSTADAVFSPSSGVGVGDNKQSYAWDGMRMKRWHGQVEEAGSYGQPWRPGSVIGCSIDLAESGEIRFSLNGDDFGPAFVLTKHELGLEWFPTVSVSTYQQCRVILQDSNLRFGPPTGYHAVSDVLAGPGPLVPLSLDFPD